MMSRRDVIEIDFIKELEKFGLTPETYELACEEIDAKIDGENDLDWIEIKDKYSMTCNPDTIRKGSTTIFGGKFRIDYFKNKLYENSAEFSKSDEIDTKLEELRRERMKLQTVNIERSRLDRNQSRQELFYEYVGKVVETLPLPDFYPLFGTQAKVNYLVGLADVHYGASFISLNNEYSPEIARQRMELLAGRIIDFVNEKKLSNITIVSLGDLIQGVLRLSDLKLNDTTIVKATVEISRLVANLLNEISAYTVVNYYHVPNANHTQIRVLGAKASELADEDLEYLIGNYIKDLCANNERINIHLAKEGCDYVEPYIPGNEVIAMHGHQLKGMDNALKTVSVSHRKFYDALVVGHYHNGKEIPTYEGINGDGETLICPSFVGSDPYSDSIGKGSKASVKIFGFDQLYGHTETYKIVLN